MRNRPKLEQSPVDPRRAIPEQTGPYAPATTTKVVPFLVSGGQGSYLVDVPAGFDPRPEGVQLVASVYIPRGSLGFLKQIRVAPFMPPVFADPWRGWSAHWRQFDETTEDPIRPAGQIGMWETPFGWESYYDPGGEPVVIPEWRWYLRIMRGNALKIHDLSNIGPFDLADSQTWLLVPDVAVPIAGYRSGLPGNSVGEPFEGQRVQVLQGDQLSLHIPITEDTTLCLFTKWKQDVVGGFARDDNGVIDYADERNFYPLLPSFGQLLGYTQAISSQASVENANHGWGA